MTVKIAVFASGNGSNLESLIKHQGSYQIEVVVCNNPNARALFIADKNNIPSICINHRGLTREEHEFKIIEALVQYDLKSIVLAGYMRVITKTLLTAYPAILNIHPANPVQYRGPRGYEFAIGSLPGSKRLTETAITIHFIDEGVDTGPIVAQMVLPIYPDDDLNSLKERGLRVEHLLYPAVLNSLCQ